LQSIADKEAMIDELKQQTKTAERISHATDTTAYWANRDVVAPEKSRDLFRGTVSNDPHHWFANTAVFPAHCCQQLRNVKV